MAAFSCLATRRPVWLAIVPLLIAVASSGAAATAPADEQVDENTAKPIVSFSADEMLALAENARTAGDLKTAEAIYRALFADPAQDVRSEARFRLAMLFVASARYSEAAILFRTILDDQPDAQRVRLELARTLDLMGDEAGARRALREAQAGRLPPDVAQFVDRYSAALRAQKPFGVTLDIAIAPDTNINRATRSQTLGTVIGDFELDDDARRRSGLGLALRGQSYMRVPLMTDINLLGRVSGSGDVYRDQNFSDFALAATLGPELRSGSDRLSLEFGGLLRWYGGRSYARAATISANMLHPLGRQAQLRAAATMAVVDNRLNRVQDGRTYSASLSYERAISNRAGFGVGLSGDRQDMRHPGYASWGGQASIFAYREIGAITLVGTAGIGMLEADERLLLFPTKRRDESYRASLAATFRRLRIGQFAPFARVTFERNHSTIEIYDYKRVRTEFGVTARPW